MNKGEKRPTTRGDKSDKNKNRPDSGGLSHSKTGTFIFKDGSRYEGEYKEVEGGAIVRHGTGKFMCGTSKCTYVGSWELDKMHGKGRLEYPSGASYEGQWKENSYHGPGIYKWSDSSTLVGDWSENGVNGPSKFVDAGGQSWAGKVFKGVVATLAPEIV